MLINCHSCYSFKYGVIRPEELLVLAERAGMETIALTNINNTSACLDFLRLAKKFPVRAVAGIDFRNGTEQQFTTLAKNNEGFLELNNFLSHHRHHQQPFSPRHRFSENVFVVYPLEKFPGEYLRENEFVGIRPSQANSLSFSFRHYRQEKLVILQPATFRGKRDFNTHRLLRAIDNNTLLSKLPKSEEASATDLFPARETLLNGFSGFPRIIANTENLLNACHLDFDPGNGHNNRKYYTDSPENDWHLIRQLCREGLAYRYPDACEKIRHRVEMELDIIRQKEFLSYFLITRDIISYARQKGYFYVGRGSGANSIVAYLLRITDVDPVELDLYFERSS